MVRVILIVWSINLIRGTDCWSSQCRNWFGRVGKGIIILFIVKLENPLHLSTKPVLCTGQCVWPVLSSTHEVFALLRSKFWCQYIDIFQECQKRDWRTTARNLMLESLKRCIYEFSKSLQGLWMFSRDSQWVWQCLAQDNLSWRVTALAEIVLKMCQYYRRSWEERQPTNPYSTIPFGFPGDEE